MEQRGKAQSSIICTHALITNPLCDSFEGTIPVHLFGKPSLRIMDLHKNRLDGVLPQSIPENQMLLLLSIHDNDLSGRIPPTIANLKALEHLDCKFCWVYAALGIALACKTELRSVLLSHCFYCLTVSTVSLFLLSHCFYCLTLSTVSLFLLSHSNSGQQLLHW